MISLEFFVEEQSMEIALSHLVPSILGAKDVLLNKDYGMEVFNLNGKMALLKNLPNRLRAYHRFMQHDQYLFILIDRDDDNCKELKQQLEIIAKEALLPTRTVSPNSFQVVNRIVIEELEAWYFGDVNAIKKAYPRYNPKNPAKYRNPDEISGGTWEALGRELAYYHRGEILEKTRAAREIAPHMNPTINQSRSFQVFRDALLALFP